MTTLECVEALANEWMKTDAMERPDARRCRNEIALAMASTGQREIAYLCQQLVQHHAPGSPASLTLVTLCETLRRVNSGD